MSVMSVKGGTQTWSTAQQTSSLKSDKGNQLSAALPEQFEGKSLGDVANQIADPNYVDPAKARKVGGGELDKDAFLKLMLTQMKHQDPTNPLKSHEMAAQLAQFTSLEQLFNMNETLKGIKDGQAPTSNFEVLNFIGKSVSGDASKVTRSKGDKEHEFNFNLPTAASEISVKVRNAGGEIIRTYSLKNLDKGPQKISWNGLAEDGHEARPGDYTFVAEAKASNGAKIVPQTEFSGRITGVNYTNSGPVLLIGNQSVRLSDVKKIVDGQLTEAQNQQSPKPLDLSKQDKAAENKKKMQERSANKATEPEQNNLADLGMSGEFAERVKKETQSGS